jgi:hypothetical protein
MLNLKEIQIVSSNRGYDYKSISVRVLLEQTTLSSINNHYNTHTNLLLVFDQGLTCIYITHATAEYFEPLVSLCYMPQTKKFGPSGTVLIIPRRRNYARTPTVRIQDSCFSPVARGKHRYSRFQYATTATWLAISSLPTQ